MIRTSALPTLLRRGTAPAHGVGARLVGRAPRGRTRGGPAIRAYVLALIAVGALASVVAWRIPDTSDDLLAWWQIAAGYALASAFVVHVHFRRDAHTVTLEEVPLTLGLLLASPGALLSGSVAGTAVALVGVRRQPPLKLACNLALQLCTVSGALVLRHVFLGDMSTLSGPGRLYTALATLLVAGLGSAGAVTVAMRLSGDLSALRRTVSILPVTLAACALNVLLGLAGARVIAGGDVTAAVFAVPCVACVFAYRRYTREHSERARLGLLYDGARALAGAREVDAVVRALLSHARELVRGERAELLLLPADSDAGLVRVRIDTAGAVDVQAIEEETTISQALVDARGRVLARGSRDPGDVAALEGLAARDAVVVPLRGEGGPLGCLAVVDRTGDVSSFAAEDLTLLETFAAQAATSLSHARVTAELHDLAYHDVLTGLANRAYLIRRLEAVARRRTQRSGDGDGFALAYLDLDDFKTVNDSLGHAAGDRLLSEVAARLRRSLRAGDLAARLGGDEFCVVFEGVDGPEEAASVAERLLATLQSPICVDGTWFVASASVGVVVVGRDADIEATALLTQADVAMYRAKDRGKGGVELFEPSMQAQVLERHRLKLDLETAIRQRRLSVAYQPIADLKTGRIAGVEALARWTAPRRGEVPPSDFIPLAEETGLVNDLGVFMLEEACAQVAAWQRFQPDLFVSVNVSGRQLRDPGFPATVARVLEESGLDAARLTLEVTETVMVTDDVDHRNTLRALRDLGCSLAIDDFGTGYSSLASLQELPVDTLKIAKPFIDGLGRGPERDAFARAIVGLGHTLGLTMIAEGIETGEQARRLRALTCSMGQGYLLGRPLPAGEIERLLTTAAA